MESCKTNEFWAGSFGDEYTKRNRVNWQARIPFWTDMLCTTGATSGFELGCNAGWNMLALRTVNPEFYTIGCDVNEEARIQARNLGFEVIDNYQTYRGAFKVDLVFTCGVLIHVPPELLSITMQDLISFSNKYVLAVEYFDTKETEVTYRGHADKLWKRPYGELYKKYGLKLIETGWAQGFDECHYFLFEKS